MIDGNLDIGKVHSLLDGKDHGRQCGNTTAMLASALGNADFGPGNFAIVAHDYQHAEYLSQQLMDIAYKMDFKYVERLGNLVILVNKVCYEFISKNLVDKNFTGKDDFDGYFTDNSVWEV